MERKHIPNVLTALRALIALALGILFFGDFPHRFLVLFVLFALAAMTDFFDGFLARRWRVISNFGIFFDSLCDKLLTILLQIFLFSTGVVFPPILLLLIARDIVIDGVKSFSAAHGVFLPARFAGKAKFVAQVVMIGSALLFLEFRNIDFFHLCAEASAIIALGFSLFSAGEYILCAQRKGLFCEKK